MLRRSNAGERRTGRVSQHARTTDWARRGHKMKAGIGRVSRRTRAAWRGRRGGSRGRVGGDTGLPDDLGAEHQGRGAAPCRAAGHRDPDDRRAGDQGSRLHRADAGTENADLLNRFLSQSSAIDCADVSIVFMQIPGRPRRAADDPGRQGQGLGQDDPAVHQGRLSRRPRGLEAGRGALHGALRRPVRTARSSPTSRPTG